MFSIGDIYSNGLTKITVDDVQGDYVCIHHNNAGNIHMICDKRLKEHLEYYCFEKVDLCHSQEL